MKYLKKIYNYMNTHRVYLFFSCLIFAFLVGLKLWMRRFFPNATAEEVIFFLQMPVEGVDCLIIKKFIRSCIIKPVIIVLAIFFFPKICQICRKMISDIFKKKATLIQIIENNKIVIFIAKNYQGLFASISTIGILIFAYCYLGFMSNTYSTFYEENYVYPENVQLEFGPSKPNLILLNVESLEKGFSDMPGTHHNLIPDIEALKGVRFSDYQNGFATTFTQSNVIATWTGCPSNFGTNYFINAWGKYILPFKNSLSLGKILKNAGYKEIFITGTDGTFAGANPFLKEHGIDEVIDETTIKNMYPQYDSEGWGYNDKTIMEIVQKTIEKNKDFPFFLFIQTIDTHSSNVLENPVAVRFENKYENTIYNTNLAVKDFMNWLKKQPFYQNTVVVIVGDHLRMDEDVDYPDKRNIYNVFINTKQPVNTNRTFSQIDMFPTIIEALGIKIPGHQLGLGVSVFSDKQTLLEKYSYETLERELKKKNNLYKHLWMGNEKQD